MRRTPERLLVLVAIGVLVGGCGRPSTAAEPVATTTVDLPPSYRFEPLAIRVARGATVTWTNHDNFTHTVQVTGQPDVHTMKPGEATQITFDTPGEYPYICTLHTQNMRGTVTVT